MNAKPITVHGKPVGGGAVPLICAPLVGCTSEAVRSELGAILPKRPDVLEWRVDHFANIASTSEVIELARGIKAAAGDIPLLFTRRSSEEGGEEIALSEAHVVELYAQVCAAGCVDLVDYELGHAADDLRRVRAVSREYDVAMIMSHHNFKATPPAADLVATLMQAERLGADVGKIAVMPTSLDDVLTLLDATLQASRATSIPLITMSMGASGSLSRIVGGAFGSALTFAVGHSASAPGQIAIDELRAALGTVARAVGRT